MDREATEPPRADPDAADVRAAARGDVRAFERLYFRHAPRVRATARWLIGSADTDATVQDVFVRLWQQLPSFAGRSSFRTWFNRVAVNVMLRRRERADRDGDRSADVSALELHPSREARADLRSEMEDAVNRLPPRAKEVFVLHDVQGYTPAEIASMLGLTLNTVRSQIMRARLRLRHHLADSTGRDDSQ